MLAYPRRLIPGRGPVTSVLCRRSDFNPTENLVADQGRENQCHGYWLQATAYELQAVR